MYRKRFGKAGKKLPYDKETQVPIIKASICTGEQVAGFKDKNTGKFEEVMLVRDSSDLNDFLNTYGLKLENVKKEY